MKKCLLVFVVLSLLSIGLYAASKELRIQQGAMVVEEMDFAVESVNVSSPSVIRVECMKNNKKKVCLTGLQPGISNVQVTGDGQDQIFNISVVSDLREQLNAIRRDLDAVSELDISLNNGRIVLKGEISTISNMELKSKVVAAYSDIILDLSTFRPTPEVMSNLQKNFEKAGFSVVRNGAESKPGEISITQIGEMLTISGSVYSSEDLNTINSIIASQPWITINSDNKADDKNKVQAFVKVRLTPIMLQIDVVHIALNDNERHLIGNQLVGLNQVLQVESQLVNVVTSGSDNSHSTSITAEGSLGSILGVFGKDGFTRIRRSGFLTFRSDATTEWRELHDGQKIWLSSGSKAVAGETSNAVTVTSSSTLTEVKTGLILKVRGGLTGKDSVSLDLDQEISVPGAPEHGESYQVNTTNYCTSIQCKLGETIAIGGLSNFLQTKTNSASIPFLRNVPVLKWCFSQEDDQFNNNHLLTLVCVHEMVKPGSIDPVAAELNKMKLEEDAAEAERQKKQHRNDGKWYEFWRW